MAGAPIGEAGPPGEKVWFEDDTVKVVPGGVSILGTTYPLATIKECKAEHTVSAFTTPGPLSLPAKIIGGIGLVWTLVAVGSNYTQAFGDPVAFLPRLYLPLALGVFGALFHGQTRSFTTHKHNVLLITESGKKKALSRADAAYIAKVVQAINDALVFRG